MGLLWAMTLPGLACLLILLAFVEVVFSRITGRGLLPLIRVDLASGSIRVDRPESGSDA
ncbi:hypothetical protein AB4Z09_18985 [Rhodococcus sp. TAF43]|uniref:hypothetical protein n=1 Tax=unclassified Rhodococcus (in: high G+C Gram-positive bacteria) TaxID=192944 RepID=UPI000E2A4CEE|nr:hypothetical protein [Rhodococcus sp. AG1013]RDI26827.1 hypothetical protein DEU38_10862 [Rhodococcus sp. AG1013]